MLDDFHLKVEDYNPNKKYKWYMSINNFSILNSFKNISKDINDSIELYIQNTETIIHIADDFDLNKYINPSDQSKGKFLQFFNKTTFRFKEGNPSIGDIIKLFEAHFDQYKIVISYNEYTSKFQITSKYNEFAKLFIKFSNTDTLLGFNKNTYYYMNQLEIGDIYDDKFVEADFPCNLSGDYLINLSICPGSDFQTKKIYTNFQNGSKFLLSNICKTFIINVPVYNMFNYERLLNDKIEIELNKNYIQQFNICLRNQDGGFLEGLNYYTLNLSFWYETEATIDYVRLIYEKINLIYLWIAGYLSQLII